MLLPAFPIARLRPGRSRPTGFGPIRSSGARAASAPILALALGLALGLSACHKADDGGSAGTAGSVAAVAPPAGQQWSDVVVKTTDNAMRMGNPNAPIKLVEYGSLSCPHCAHLAQEGMQKLISRYVDSGEVSYEFHSFAIHPQDVPLTVLVRCAQPGAFFGLVEQIYANFDPMNAVLEKNLAAVQATDQLPAAQRAPAMADAAGYTAFFSARGLPVAQAHACLANTANAEAVANEADATSAKGIDSTPTLIINGAKSSALSWPELEAALQAAGAH